eukprot:12902368-Alexandrium_andersonii.AAC.1
MAGILAGGIRLVGRLRDESRMVVVFLGRVLAFCRLRPFSRRLLGPSGVARVAELPALEERPRLLEQDHGRVDPEARGEVDASPP